MVLLEVVATLAGLLCVAMVVRQNIWCWPVGLVQTTLYIVLFMNVRLYSDVILQVVFTVLQIVGWYQWLHGGKDRGALEVSAGGFRRTLAWLGVALAGTLALGTFMARLTDAALPYWDAATTVGSLVAQLLMNRKILESWLFWISVDVLSVGIYLNKGLLWTAGLYAVYLGLATLGFFEWKRELPAPATA